MNVKELKYIADIEMMREGILSKGVRLEVVNAAKEGHKFTLEVSTDDSIRIAAEMRRKGLNGRMSMVKSKTPNRKVLTFNHSK